MAAAADKYDLYRRAVQSPDSEIDFVDETFQALRSRKASRLREDFCAAGATACEWIRRRKANTAVGLDIDPVPLAWGQAHTIGKLTQPERRRIELRQASVLESNSDLVGAFDIVLAMNFSYWTFTRRSVLLEYFRLARAALVRDGIFFLDFMGGSEAHLEVRERRNLGRAGRAFTYIWDQQRFNPITADFCAAIHFKFPDGSRLKNAFVYRWRLWGIAEIRDALAEAGFSRSTVYWEGDDGKGGGNGDFKPTEEGEACAGYIGYIAAER